jgi:hypothetical protein
VRGSVQALLLTGHPAKTIVASGARVAMTRASSIMAATPDPSSSAPGASAVKFSTSVTRESMCPVTT